MKGQTVGDRLLALEARVAWLEQQSGNATFDASAVESLPSAWTEFGDLAKHVYMVRLLIENGYTTPVAVRAATDQELLDINGIGPKSLGALRAVLGSGLAADAEFAESVEQPEQQLEQPAAGRGGRRKKASAEESAGEEGAAGESAVEVAA